MFLASMRTTKQDPLPAGKDTSTAAEEAPPLASVPVLPMSDMDVTIKALGQITSSFGIWGGDWKLAPGRIDDLSMPRHGRLSQRAATARYIDPTVLASGSDALVFGATVDGESIAVRTSNVADVKATIAVMQLALRRRSANFALVRAIYPVDVTVREPMRGRTVTFEEAGDSARSAFFIEMERIDGTFLQLRCDGCRGSRSCTDAHDKVSMHLAFEHVWFEYVATMMLGTSPTDRALRNMAFLTVPYTRAYHILGHVIVMPPDTKMFKRIDLGFQANEACGSHTGMERGPKREWRSLQYLDLEPVHREAPGKFVHMSNAWDGVRIARGMCDPGVWAFYEDVKRRNAMGKLGTVGELASVLATAEGVGGIQVLGGDTPNAEIEKMWPGKEVRHCYF